MRPMHVYYRWRERAYRNSPVVDEISSKFDTEGVLVTSLTPKSLFKRATFGRAPGSLLERNKL